ncbi:ATP-binding protein [Streptomyces sviceus]|uniref:ATP-binding protein n=1 Tax=Streptomyces sviceus TaxID=285530 RepID=UPI0036945750
MIVGNLPAAFTSFVGRREEVAEVRRLLGAARLVTLTGAGGIGKTRLALEVAAASAKAFPGGVWLVDLASVHEPSAVADVAAAVLGVADVGTRPLVELLAAHLSGRRVLLVLDNCEHLVGACAQVAQQLLSATAELRILATSRETLQVTGEHVLAVAPLPEADAVELLRQRTAAVRPGFEVTEANRAGVARLCADLDGLPLAIELAASRLRAFSVEQVVERLEDRFGLLTAGSRTAQPHQRTLRAAIDWSWELCGHQERLLWSRLSVFVGSFTLEAAEGVCAGEGVEAWEVVDLLDRLVTKSLVEHPRGGEPPRYHLLESIRRYGWEHLVASGGAEQVRRCHRAFFLALAERLHQDWFGPGQAEILARLRAEHANLRAALEYGGNADGELAGAARCGLVERQSGAVQTGDRQARLALAGALLYHWVAGGFLGEGRRQLERALAAAPEPTAARARALVAAAYVAQLQLDLAAAERWLQEAEELSERLGEPAVRAHARGHRSVSALYGGRLEEALSYSEQAVAAHTALGDRFGELTWRCTLAISQVVARDPRALGTARQALADTEAHGERWARAHLLMVLGRRAWALGDQHEAKELTVSALKTLRGFADSIAVAKMVEQYAWITASDADHERAGRLLGTAHCLRQDTGITLAASSPQDEDYHARCEAEVLRALGPADYDRALKEGACIDGPDQAIACILAPHGAPERAAPRAATSGLTRREQQVAALVARGMTNRRIAAELVLSPRTVETHVDRILTKLGFSSRAQIAAWWATRSVPNP